MFLRASPGGTALVPPTSVESLHNSLIFIVYDTKSPPHDKPMQKGSHFLRFRGMSGCRAPWSMTMPLIRVLSVADLCFICMISTCTKHRAHHT